MQEVIATSIVIIASLILLRRAYRTFKVGSSCGGCNSCSANMNKFAEQQVKSRP